MMPAGGLCWSLMLMIDDEREGKALESDKTMRGCLKSEIFSPGGPRSKPEGLTPKIPFSALERWNLRPTPRQAFDSSTLNTSLAVHGSG